MEEQGYCEHHFSNFVYTYFTKNIAKNGAGNGCGTNHVVRTSNIYSAISISEVPDTFHIEILYIEAGAHSDLIVPINAHNILAPPQLTTVRSFSMLDELERPMLTSSTADNCQIHCYIRSKAHKLRSHCTKHLTWKYKGTS